MNRWIASPSLAAKAGSHTPSPRNANREQRFSLLQPPFRTSQRARPYRGRYGRPLIAFDSAHRRRACVAPRQRRALAAESHAGRTRAAAGEHRGAAGARRGAPGGDRSQSACVAAVMRWAVSSSRSGTTLVDMTGLAGVIDVDADRGLVTVDAGIDWVRLINHLLWTFPNPEDAWGIIQKQTGADQSDDRRRARREHPRPWPPAAAVRRGRRVVHHRRRRR